MPAGFPGTLQVSAPNVCVLSLFVTVPHPLTELPSQCACGVGKRCLGFIKTAAGLITPLHPHISFSGLCCLMSLDLVLGIQHLNQPARWR